MLTQDVRVHYIGFHPSPVTDMTLKEWAEEVHTESPRAANIKIVYSRTGQDYQCEMRVSSRAGFFHTHVRGPNLYAVARAAQRRLRRQLMKWKTKRHRAHLDEISPSHLQESEAS
jgi:ribosome-associated translation inhibitor RaiA